MGAVTFANVDRGHKSKDKLKSYQMGLSILHYNVIVYRGNTAMTSSLEGNCIYSILITASVSHISQALIRLNGSMSISKYKVSCIVPEPNDHIHSMKIHYMCR